MEDFNLDVETSLVLRTCNSDGTSNRGFQWPLEIGSVAACDDWTDEAVCGGGLHGALYGKGKGNLLDWSESAIWMVVEMPTDLIVDLVGKVKAPWARVVHVGDQSSATSYLLDRGHTDVIGATVEVRKGGTATAGDHGTATAGKFGSATVGDNGTATAGRHGTAIAGHFGTATVGDNGSASVGDYGSATAEYEGKATAGYDGSATAGIYGTATVGKYGTASAGKYGTAKAGEYGQIMIDYYCEGRRRTKVGYIGEDGLLPDVAYKLNDKGEFVEA